MVSNLFSITSIETKEGLKSTKQTKPTPVSVPEHLFKNHSSNKANFQPSSFTSRRFENQSLNKDTAFLSQSVKDQIETVDSAIKKINDSIQIYENCYNSELMLLKQASGWLDYLFSTLTYVNDTGEHRSTTARPFLNPSYYQMIDQTAEQIELANDCLSPFKLVFDLIIERATQKKIARACAGLEQTTKQIKKTEKKFQEPQKIRVCFDRVNQLRHQLHVLEKNSQKRLQSANKKLSQLAICQGFAYPLADWLSSTQESMKKTVKRFFKIISHYDKWKETNATLALQKNITHSSQPTLYVEHVFGQESEICILICNLQACHSIKEVKTTLKQKGIKTQLPKTLAEFKHQLSEDDFQKKLSLAYCRAKGQQLIETQKTEINLFIRSLKNCKTISEVKEKLQLARIEHFQLPEELEQIKSSLDNPLIIKQLNKAYRQTKGLVKLIDAKKMADKLKFKQQAFIDRIKYFETKIGFFLDQPSTDFDQINQSLKEFNIRLSIEEWDEQKTDPKLKRILAQRAAQHEEALTIMLEKANRACFLQKIALEKETVRLSRVEAALEIALRISQVTLALPRMSQLALLYMGKVTFSKLMLDYLNAELTFNGSGFLYLLNDKLEETVGGLIKQIGVAAVGYLFLKRKQPHLYSFQALNVEMQMKWLGLVYTFSCGLLSLQELLLQFRIRMIDSLKTSVFTSSQTHEKAYTDLKNCIDKQASFLRTHESQIMILKDKLQQFILTDFNEALGLNKIKNINEVDEQSQQLLSLLKLSSSLSKEELTILEQKNSFSNSQQRLKQLAMKSLEKELISQLEYNRLIPIDPTEELTKGLIALIKNQEELPNELVQGFKTIGIDLNKHQSDQWQEGFKTVFSRNLKQLLTTYQTANDIHL